MYLIKNIFLLFLFLLFCFFFHNCAPLVAKGGFVEGGITVSGAASTDDTDDDEDDDENDDTGDSDGGGAGDDDEDEDDNDDEDDEDDEDEEPIGEEFDGTETEEGGRAPVTRSLH